MNRILTLTSIFIICFLLLSSLTVAEANTYYVTQNGNGSRSGASLINALSASDFNALSGTGYAGDTFYFAGTFSTRIVIRGLKGASGHPVTLDGYEAGDCDPINAVCTGSADLKKGMGVGEGTTDPDYINIQDFRMTRNDGNISTFQIYAKSGGSIDHLNIRRNYVYMSDGNAFYYYGGNYSVVENNKFYVFGQGGDPAQMVDLIETDDFILRGNEIGHNENSYPSDCTSAEIIELHGCNRVLIEYNDIYGAPQQSGIRPKEWGRANSSNIVIRFNKIHDNKDSYGGHGILADVGSYGDSQSISNLYIYGNYVYNNYMWGIGVASGINGAYIWSNITAGNGRQGIISFHNYYSPQNIYIYNNTVSNNGRLNETDSARGGIVVTAGSNVNIKNNLLYNNRPSGAGSKYNQIYSSVALASLEHDTIYHSIGTASFYYDGAIRTLATMQKTYNMEDTPSYGEIASPGFINPAGPDNTYGTADDDYRLNGRYINNGASLSQCFDVSIQGKNYHMCYDDALDPNATNWRTTIPIVRTTKQGANGAWERGAYAYGTGSGSPDITAPSGLQIIVGNN